MAAVQASRLAALHRLPPVCGLRPGRVTVTATDQRRPWLERPTLAGQIVKAAVLTIVALAVIYPFASVVATSVSSEQDVLQAGGLVLIPLHPNLDAYATILSGGVI